MVLYLLLPFFFVLSIVLFVYLEKLRGRMKRLRKTVKKLEGAPEPIDEPPEWL